MKYLSEEGNLAKLTEDIYEDRFDLGFVPSAPKEKFLEGLLKVKGEGNKYGLKKFLFN